jgi:hypothetical protein
MINSIIIAHSHPVLYSQAERHRQQRRTERPALPSSSIQRGHERGVRSEFMVGSVVITYFLVPRVIPINRLSTLTMCKAALILTLPMSQPRSRPSQPRSPYVTSSLHQTSSSSIAGLVVILASIRLTSSLMHFPRGYLEST